METKSRTWVKAVCWQGLGLFSMAGVGVLITGSVATGGAMALINAVVGLLVYIVYERVWNRISWGRNPINRG